MDVMNIVGQITIIFSILLFCVLIGLACKLNNLKRKTFTLISNIWRNFFNSTMFIFNYSKYYGYY